MEITKNAKMVLEKRYLAKDESGNPTEDIPGMVRRVAHAVAQAEAAYSDKPEEAVAEAEKEFLDVMTRLDFLPNSPTLMNAGRPLGQLSACFVLPVEDSMEGIFDSIKHAALIHKSGGGTGFSFSRLRGNGSSVHSTGGVASGPISFMKAFNAATEAVKQGGTRRGANMGILRVDHPDILEFINCKNDTTELTNFNLSVGITEVFMEAVNENGMYHLIDPHTGAMTVKLRAREVFDKIVDSAWRTGEPGIVFLDRINTENPTPQLGEIESTNPCGEQPLLPYEACNLGSINLLNHLIAVNGKYQVDEDKLAKTVNIAVRFLDDVIDVNLYPLPEIDKMTKSTRKIGLGVMGFADMLLKMGIPYNSKEGVAVASSVMKFISSQGMVASRVLAAKRGPFPAYTGSIYTGLIRNATVTTIAPTGTLSIIAGVSSGVEPVFAYAYTNEVMDGDTLVETNPILRQALIEHGVCSDDVLKAVAEAGTLAHVSGVPSALKRVFVCAHDITPEWHIKMQAAFQQHTDNAVSKTVNFPGSATRDDVAEAYRLAYELGCKGITIYRDGSRDSQVLNVGNGKKGPEVNSAQPGTLKPRPRPTMVSGFTEKVKIGCGNLYITVNSDENGICEVFTNTGRTGGCPSQSEATARLVSVAIRSGVDPQEIIDQLKGIRCPSCQRKDSVTVLSCPDAIAKALELHLRNVPPPKMSAQTSPEPVIEMTVAEVLNAKFCPECGKPLEHEGGCVTCRECGYSKCG